MSIAQNGIAAVFFGMALMVASAANAADPLVDVLVKKGALTKEEAESVQNRKVSSIVDRISFYGDVAVRQETQWFDDDDNDGRNRNRQRFRLRLGTDIERGETTLHVRLASSSGHQVSLYQTFDNFSSPKPIWIDWAYIEYGRIPALTLLAGKMDLPFAGSLTSDLVFDEDWSPEGFAEQVAFEHGADHRLFLNLAQIVLDGDTSGANSQWLLGYQAGGEIKAGNVGVLIAALYYHLANGTRSGFGQPNVQEGNTRVDTTECPSVSGTPVACRLANPFRVAQATVQLTLKAGIPITISGDYVKNLADTDQTPTIEGEDSGFELGVKLGSAKKAGGYELVYVYRTVETDATLADFADSEFGPRGGVNREGHIVTLNYGLSQSAVVGVKYYNTKIENDDLPPAFAPPAEKNPTHNRIQVNFVVGF